MSINNADGQLRLDSTSIASRETEPIRRDSQAPEPAARQAGRIVHECDFILLAGGAGLSADSGLATFATMSAKLGATLGEGITYDQAAGSDMMARDPALFYGFHFAASNNYAAAEPHEGYSVLREWRQWIEDRATRRERKADLPAGPGGPAFALTSNIDGFLQRSGAFVPGGLAQIHGCVNKWQCGGVPSGQRFPLFSQSRCSDELFESPPAPEGMDYETMRCNAPAPRCPRCGEGWLRPHVYLFGDGARFADREEETGSRAFSNWNQEVLSALRADARLRLAIVEIGCGLRVPNIRKRCEELFAACPPGQGELIRINPELSGHQFHAQPTVVVQATALDALRQIHQVALELRQASRSDLLARCT